MNNYTCRYPNSPKINKFNLNHYSVWCTLNKEKHNITKTAKIDLGSCIVCNSNKFVTWINYYQRTKERCKSQKKTCLYSSRFMQRRGSAVGVATGYELDDKGVRVQVPVRSIIFTSPHPSDWLWGPHSLLTNRYHWLSHQGMKRQRCEAEHSPPTMNSSKANKTWIYISTPPYAFIA
jgi:hypothetical protein